MTTTYHKKMERNIVLFSIWKIFTKRAYLPLIAIYAVAHAGVSLEQIGIIAAITAVVSLSLEIPSGYLSDKMGHKKALLLGSFIVMLSPLGYVFYPNFYGILFGMAAFFGGVAFHSGTVQAFIHETLEALGRPHAFAAVNARAQRWGLIGNIALISLVPLTYTVDPRLPFVLGFFLFAIGFVVVSFFTEPKRNAHKAKDAVAEGFWELLTTIRSRGEILLFMFLGVATATANKLPEFREIYFQDIGVPLWLFGIILALSNVVGILFTYTTKWFGGLEPRTFYLVDYLWVGLFGVIIGLISNPFIGVLVFVASAGYGRVRQIIIHTNLLRTCPTQSLKATYLSVYSFFAALMSTWIPIALGYAVGTLGVRSGYSTFGMGILLLLTILFILSRKAQGGVQKSK